MRQPPPPRQGSSELEKQQWFERLVKTVNSNVQLVSDTAATIGSTITYVGVTALTAGRALTLPATADMQDGDEIVFQDESGAAGTYTITISRSGSDTINGGTSVSISSNYGRKRIIKRGAGKFYSA